LDDSIEAANRVILLLEQLERENPALALPQQPGEDDDEP